MNFYLTIYIKLPSGEEATFVARPYILAALDEHPASHASDELNSLYAQARQWLAYFTPELAKRKPPPEDKSWLDMSK